MRSQTKLAEYKSSRENNEEKIRNNKKVKDGTRQKFELFDIRRQYFQN